jgi:poly-gamma-glutamate synthesis protein (capsule biosynthesis protein)
MALSSTLPDHNAARGRFQQGPAVFFVAWALMSGGCAAPLRVVAAGDLQLDGEARADPLASFALDGDVRFVNLEGPLTTRGAASGLDAAGAPSGGPIRFRAPPERAAWLRGRVEVASLANNHALDQGEAGRDDTAGALANAGVAAAWPGHDARISRRGTRLIVLARDYPPDADLDRADELVAAVAQARGRGVPIVSLHWGDAGSLIPTAAQRRLAARLVDEARARCSATARTRSRGSSDAPAR